MNNKNLARRKLLQFLCTSPLLAGMSPLSLAAGSRDPALQPLPDALYPLIESPDQALDVFDFQRVAEHVLPPAHYGYMATGTEGNETLRANRTAFEKLYLRAMRMVDTSKIDTGLELLGEKLPSPIVLAPVSSQAAFHDDGEMAAARATGKSGHLQVVSNLTNFPIEDINRARTSPAWMQLYPTQDFKVATKMVQRAERAGCRVLVLTVDLHAGSKRTPLDRFIRQDTRDCEQCHDSSRPDNWLDRRPMYFDTGVEGSKFDTPEFTWDYLAQLRSITGMKLVIKGIVTAEDALDSVKHGVDAVYVSNHGGRAEASGWGAIDSLPEVVEAVDGEVPVMIDSGFRRGTDVFKALALGADAVCVGRPYVWGLAAFGQPGVESVLGILQAELEMVMAQIGTPTLNDITPQFLGRHG